MKLIKFVISALLLINQGSYCDSKEDSNLNYTSKSYEGKILEIKKNPDSKDNVISVVFQTPKKNFIVELGPAWYLEKNHFDLKIADKATLNAYDCGVGHSCNLIALKISIQDRELKFRGPTGKPIW